VLAALGRSRRDDRARPDDPGGRRRDQRPDQRGHRALGARDVDLVVEAIAEDLEIKQELFRDLDRICKPGAILATTTSSLPIIDCAKVTSRPQDVIGMHFFNPAQVMKLVEVVHTVTTAPDVIATVQDLCAKVGKVAVTCGDRSGFIVNALLFPYLNDAIKMLEANYASADDIDTAMKTGCGLPMGPFELLDVVGLDVSLAIERELYTEFREPGYAPAPLLEHLVTGRLPRAQDRARVPHLRLTGIWHPASDARGSRGGNTRRPAVRRLRVASSRLRRAGCWTPLTRRCTAWRGRGPGLERTGSA
jgi:3-hydroxyacyl-CoA dehydrogenase